MTTSPRTDSLTTVDMYNLDHACLPIRLAFGTYPYLVGSAGETASYRDVDVRLILNDEDFDRYFGDARPAAEEADTALARWELLSLALGDYLRQRTGLAIDFQIQRMSKANELHGNKMRNPLGYGRHFAAGGDATPWTGTV